MKVPTVKCYNLPQRQPIGRNIRPGQKPGGMMARTKLRDTLTKRTIQSMTDQLRSAAYKVAST